MKKAVTAAVKTPAKRKMPTKLDVARAVAPTEESYPIKQTAAAYAAGYLTAVQQAIDLLSKKVRSFGEAIDVFQRFSGEMQEQMSAHVSAELLARGKQVEGRKFRLVATPEGPIFVMLNTPGGEAKAADSQAAAPAPAKRGPGRPRKSETATPAKAPATKRAVRAPKAAAAAPVAKVKAAATPAAKKAAKKPVTRRAK